MYEPDAIMKNENVSCYVSQKANLAQKVLGMDPTIVSLPLDARRTKCQWSFDSFACLTCSFAPARRLPRETYGRHRQGQKKDLRPIVKCAPARSPSLHMRFRYMLKYAFMQCLPTQTRFLCVRMYSLARSCCLASLR